MPLSDYARRGRRIAWVYIAWKAYEEWTDDDLGLGDLYAGLALTAATVALVVPDPVSTAVGWAATRGSAPLVSTVIRGISNFRAGLSYGGAIGFPKLANKFIWTAGILHLVTLPWQIEDDQQRKEREEVIDYMAQVPLEPGQSPMPLSLGLGGARIW